VKIFFLLLLTLLSLPLGAAELLVTGGGTYNYSNILGQSDVPSYQGKGYFGEFEYLMPFSSDNALSLFGTYHKSSQENSANDEIKESLEIGYMGAGLKLYFGNTYLSASIGRVKFENSVTGEVSKDISSSEVGQEIGLGYRMKLSQLFGLVISANALHASLDPSNGSGFDKDYDLWQYRGSIGLNFIIPSSAPAIEK
jgi:hypothetical protein